MRKIILHYHLFKNAGTSVDELLKLNFPGQWVTREFNEVTHASNIAQVERWVQQKQDAIAFSSHTAMLPAPNLEDAQLFPIIFVRHPIDRIASAYAFERKQGSNNFGSVLARNTTLAGYINVRLSIANDRQCRDFHVARLAQMFKAQGGDEVPLAMRAMEELPFVGLVEEFDKSIIQMAEWLAPYFGEFKTLDIAKNVTRDHKASLETKLAQINAEIGDDCYQRLIEANKGDLAIYASLQNRYADIG